MMHRLQTYAFIIKLRHYTEEQPEPGGTVAVTAAALREPAGPEAAGAPGSEVAAVARGSEEAAGTALEEEAEEESASEEEAEEGEEEAVGAAA